MLFFTSFAITIASCLCIQNAVNPPPEYLNPPPRHLRKFVYPSPRIQRKFQRSVTFEVEDANKPPKGVLQAQKRSQNKIEKKRDFKIAGSESIRSQSFVNAPNIYNAPQGPPQLGYQQPDDVKTVYVNLPPQPAPHYDTSPIPAGPPRKHYRIVFIRSPTPSPPPRPIIPPVTETKTLIYVLTPKREQIDLENIEIPSVSHDPEVFFIQYKDDAPTPEELKEIVQGSLDYSDPTLGIPRAEPGYGGTGRGQFGGPSYSQPTGISSIQNNQIGHPGSANVYPPGHFKREVSSASSSSFHPSRRDPNYVLQKTNITPSKLPLIKFPDPTVRKNLSQTRSLPPESINRRKPVSVVKSRRTSLKKPVPVQSIDNVHAGSETHVVSVKKPEDQSFGDKNVPKEKTGVEKSS